MFRIDKDALADDYMRLPNKLKKYIARVRKKKKLRTNWEVIEAWRVVAENDPDFNERMRLGC